MIRLLKPTLVGIVLVDIPVFVGILAAGLVWGFEDSFQAYFVWREEHPWTFLVTLLLVIAFVLWRHRRFHVLSEASASRGSR